MKQWYLVGYDVRDDRRLRKTAKKMEGYGSRVQLSLFRCHLSERDLQKMKWELSLILDTVDSLIVVPLCDRCAAKIELRGSIKPWEHECNRHTIV